MRIPGFTATASAHPASNHYQAATRLTEKLGWQKLVPQFRPALRCSPCINGKQFCCPPPGLGMPCTFRSCWAHYPIPRV